MYRRKSVVGTRMNPWGTPEVTGYSCEDFLEAAYYWRKEETPNIFMLHVDYVTIFNSSPVQHLRWSSLWQKNGNGWKLLLNVVT